MEPEKSPTSTSTTPPSPPPRFPAGDDAYDATRALLLSLAVTSVGSAGGGVGILADWLVGASSSFSASPLSLSDARAFAAFAVGAGQLAAVSLVAASSSPSSSSSSGAKKKDSTRLSFDFRDGRALAVGLAGGLAAAAAVAAVDLFLSSSSSSSSSSETATSLAASVLSDASGPLPSAALLCASCALAPAAEELVFRGILLRRLLLGGKRRRSASHLVAVAASAAAFAASHLSVLASDGDRSEAGKELLLLFVLGSVLGVTAVESNRGEEEEQEEKGKESESGSEGGGGEERAKRRESSDSFNLAAPALAHALYNAIAYCVAASG